MDHWERKKPVSVASVAAKRLLNPRDCEAPHTVFFALIKHKKNTVPLDNTWEFAEPRGMRRVESGDYTAAFLRPAAATHH